MEQPEMDSEVVEEITSDQPEEESLLGGDEEVVEEPAEEDEEVDIDGLKLSIPKSKAEKLKAERLMHADYTQKTQAVAEQRKQIEQQAQEVQHRAQLQQAFINEIAEVTAIDKQLAQYSQINWDALQDEDPLQAMKLERQFRQLQDQKNNVLGSLTQKQQQQAVAEQQNIAKRIHDASEFLKREIKDWSDAKSIELENYGVASGLPKEVLSNVTIHHPQFATILNKAALYDQLVKKQTPAPVAAIAKPVSKVGGTSSVVKKDPTKMTDAEFNAWRRSQIKRK